MSPRSRIIPNLVQRVSEIAAAGPSGPASAPAWGNIIGTLGDQADLSAALAGKALSSHGHPISGVTGLQAALDAKDDAGAGYAEAAAAMTDHLGNYDHTLLHSNSLDHSNTNDPTAGEKSALAGTSGTPGSGNKYVTDGDSRNTNSRTPTSHGHAPGDVTGTAVVTADSRLSDARIPVSHDNTKHSVAYLSAIALTQQAAVLGGNVTMTNANAAYDGPSISLPAGTYLIIGYVTVKSANATAQRVTAYVWNGASAYYASGEAAAPSQGSATAGYVNICLVGVAVLSGTTTVKITCKSTAGASVILQNPGDNSPGGNLGSQLVAVKIA